MSIETLATERPAEGTRTGRVWDLADEITARSGRLARRREVIERFVAEGGNANTASTQFQHWKSHRQRQPQQIDGTPPAPGSTAPQRLTITSDGRVLIPQAMREAMMLAPDGTVTAQVHDGELRLVSPRVALQKAQEMVAALVPPDVSLADELIADRRAETARDAG